MRSFPDTRARVHRAGDIEAGYDEPTRTKEPAGTAPSLASVRLEGFQEGRNEGLELGLIEGRTLAQQSVATTLLALERAIDEMSRRHRTDAERIDDLALALAVELAEEIIGRELQICDSLGVDALRRALRGRADGQTVEVRLHPEDASTIEDSPHGVQIVPDASLQRGDSILEIGGGSIDGSIATALERVREALT